MKKLSSIIVGLALFSSVFCYAEDSLNSFQQEIVVAKQKQQNISQKMDSISLALDKEKSVFLESQADSLIKELTRDGYQQTPKEIKLVPTPAPVSEPAKTEKPKTKKPAKNATFISFNNLFAKALLSIKKAELALRFLKFRPD